MSQVVEMDDVSLVVGKEEILQHIDLHIQKGEIFGLLGPSGAGKTTLVKIIAGILEATQGNVRVNGEKVPSFDLLKDTGYMAQSDALYHELTAKENLDFFASVYELKGKQKKDAIENVTNIVDLTADIDKQVQYYSGGMKRRLSLAIAMLHNPSLLILDEPTIGIDPILRQSVWNKLQDMQKQGMTIIVTTHVMDEAEKCGRLVMLRNGSVIANDTPANIKKSQSASSLEEAFLAYGGEQL